MRSDHKSVFQSVNWNRTAFGICVGMLVILLMAAGAAWLVLNEVMEKSSLGVAALAALMLGSFLGSVSSGKGEGSLVRCTVVCVGMALVLLVLNLVLCGGEVTGGIPGVLALIGGSGASALLGGGNKGRGRRKMRGSKYRNR